MSITLVKTIAGTQLPITYNGGISASSAISGYSANISADRTALDFNEDAANLKQTLTAMQSALIEAWELDETSGTRAGTKAGLTLADNNTVSYSGSITSNARRLDASTQYFTVPDASAYRLNGSSYTIAAWFYKEVATGTGTLCGKRTSNGTADWEYVLYAHNSQVMQFLISGNATSTSTISTGTTVVPAKTWTCAFAAYDSSGQTVATALNNGSYEGSASTSGKTPTTNTANVSFGALKNAAGETYANFFGGRIGVVAAFSSVLDSTERALFYNNGYQLTYAQLPASLLAKVLWWAPFESTSGNETDAKTGSTITALNSPTYRCGAYKSTQDNGSARFVIANSERLSRSAGTLTGIDSYSGNFTIETAVRFDSASTGVQTTIASNGATANNTKGFWLNKNTSEQIAFTVGDGTTRVTANTSGTVSVGALTHIVVTVNRTGNATIYLNGSVSSGGFNPRSISAIPGDLGANTFNIGGLNGATYTEGEIGYFRVYNYEMSSSDVTYLYNSGALRSYANL